ncbi:MAG: hypothetical protein ACI9KE_004049 [Polyangiales bacterium]|jgi:hypothetical protein
MKFVILLVGTLGGAALMHFSGEPIRRAAGLEGREVEANVLEESRDEDGRLVLMLESDGESMLATFRERADDVASLVHVGDVVSFIAPVNGVFADDVPLLSVRRGSDLVEDDEEADVEGSEEEGSEELEAEEPSVDEDASGAAEADAGEEPLEQGADEDGTDEADAEPLAETDSGESDPQSAES